MNGAPIRGGGPTVEAAVETVRPAAAAKGIRLQPVLDPKSRHVSGDPNRLQHLGSRLLAAERGLR